MAFRENLLHLRATNNMTQENLAVLVGVSRQSVAKWESGKAYPEMDKLIKLSQIFDCSLDDLIQGDLTGSQPKAELSVAETPQDIFGYDELMTRHARKISNGVMVIILGVAFGVLCFCVNEDNSSIGNFTISNSVLDAFGVILILAGVALGLSYLIPAGLTHNDFVKEHPYLQDFYTSSDKQAAKKSFANQLIAGICLILLGVCVLIVLEAIPQTEAYGPFVLLVCIAVGVRMLISGGITLSKVDINAYNRAAHESMTEEEIAEADVPADAKKQMLRSHKTDKRISAWCGVIMIAATIIALLMLFLNINYESGQPSNDFAISIFWLPWPIGGLLCGIVTLIFKAMDKDDE